MQEEISKREALLTALARQHKTDKIDHHSYIQYYARYLPHECMSLLEVGVAKGASLLMFDDFYEHRADIHCVDLFLDRDHVTPRWAREHNFVPYQGSQDDIGFLRTVTSQFDVISEDGSHNSGDQLITFKTLFLNNLRAGGLYVVEDVHCTKQSFYWNHGVNRFEDTILAMFKKYKETGKIDNMFFNEGEAEVFESMIDRVEICEEEIIFIWKKS